MHPKMKHIYVGVDTHRNTHTAVIIDCFNDKLGEITFKNKPSEYEAFLKFVKSHTKKKISPVFGLEDTGSSGRALAVYLIGVKHTVKSVNSNLSKAESKSQAILHKTDSFDALCVARVLLSRLNELPNANPIDIYWTLELLVTRRKGIVKSNVALKNQLHANIIHHYPSYRQFFSVFDCKTALEFWETYPSPMKLDGVTLEEFAKFLYVPSSGFFSFEKAQQILTFVKTDGNTKSEFQESRDFLIMECVKELKHNNDQMLIIENEMKKIMSLLDYKLETMIGLDLISASSIISEIGDIRRFTSPNKLAKYAGISPVTYSSGNSEKNFKSRQGNRRLYHSFHELASRNINRGRNKNKPVNDIFYEYYEKKISKGKTKHQAIICVMRRLVNIVYGLLKNKTEYIHPSIPKLVNE